MKLTIDTDLLEDPNHFGELLRDYCFIPDQYGGRVGCYQTFELKPEFKRLEGIAAKFHVKAFLRAHNDYWNEAEDTDNELYQGFMKNIYSNGDIVLFWHWDGDGMLVIKAGNKCAYNNDCKKDYVWEWIE